MSELLGTDTRRVDVIAEGLRRSSQDIRDLRAAAQRAVAEMRNAWGGQDCERLVQRWEQETGPRLTDVSFAVSTMAAVLHAQAQEQRRASGDTTGSRAPTVLGGSPGGLSGGSPARGGTTDQLKITLAEGHVTFVDRSLMSVKGESDRFQYELAAGKVSAEAGYFAGVDADGNLVASAGVSAAAYAEYAAGAVRGGNDFANATAVGKVYAGAEARAEAGGLVGPSGARGHLYGRAFLGGKAEASLSGTLGAVTATGGAEISYGIGAHAEVDAELSATEVGFSADIGVALGIGAGVKFDVSVNPQEVIGTVGQVADGVGKGLTEVGDQVASFLNW
jgi:hypothetical protein